MVSATQWGETAIWVAVAEGSLRFLSDFEEFYFSEDVLEDSNSDAFGRQLLSLALASGGPVLAFLAGTVGDFCEADSLFEFEPAGESIASGESILDLLLASRSPRPMSPARAAAVDTLSASADAISVSPAPPLACGGSSAATPQQLLSVACRTLTADTVAALLLAAHSNWTPHRLPLHYAARGARTEAVRLLLAAGHNAHAADTKHAADVQAASVVVVKKKAALAVCAEAVTSASRLLSAATRAVELRQNDRAAAVGPAALAAADAAVEAALAAEARCRVAHQDAIAAQREATRSVHHACNTHAECAALLASPLHLLALAGSERLGCDWWSISDDEELLQSDNALERTAQCAELLLAAGADANARDAFQRTPLHWASRAGNSQLVRSWHCPAGRGAHGC